MTALRPELTAALDVALETVAVVEGLEPPAFEREPRLVSLRHPTDYPMNEGRIVSTDGLDLAPTDWEDAFREDQVGWSNALQARTHAGEVYLLGPASRITLAGDRLHPRAAEVLARTGLADEIRRNPFRSIVARAVELVHATSEALDIIDDYRPPERAAEPWTPGPGVAAWATEAPRGLLFHRYELDEAGRVATARIVPPTSQNQAAIEADLGDFAPSVLRPPARRGHAPVRAADPELRPVHLVRDALPGPPRGAPIVSRAIRPVRLLVCGNVDRGDDGAPLAAVASPPAEPAPASPGRPGRPTLRAARARGPDRAPRRHGLRRGRRGDRRARRVPS